MDPSWITAATALAIAVAGFVMFIGRRTVQIITRALRFFDDWDGEPERPGVSPARLGVLARLSMVEKQITDILAETKPNGGTSLRDAVNMNTTTLESLQKRVELSERKREAHEDYHG